MIQLNLIFEITEAERTELIEKLEIDYARFPKPKVPRYRESLLEKRWRAREQRIIDFIDRNFKQKIQ
jgi:hypothetical protein